MRILAADLSLRCPGFALIDCENGRASVVKLCHIDSHGRKCCHGEILSEIAKKLRELAANADIFVREKGFFRFPQETQTLYKVVGVTDMVIWESRHSVFEELAPTTVKKLLTGNGKATKAEVAAAQEKHVGQQTYETDDESDAVAVGIAWLTQNSPHR